MMSGRIGTQVRTLRALVAVLVVVSAGIGRAGDTRLARSNDASAVVVSYSETPGELAAAEGGPSLRIFGDGRVVVHYPSYMTRAGDWSARLRQSDLDALLGSLADKGVLDSDPDALRRAKQVAGLNRRQAAVAGGGPRTVEIVSDADTTTIEVHLDAQHKKIAWYGLREDARSYPEIAGIQGLAAAGRELRALMERGDLQKVD